MFGKLRKAFKVLHFPAVRKAMLFHGVAASVEHCHALADLSCQTVIDIGANRGQFALIAKALFPAARIFSFEPLTQLAPVFRRIFANDPDVHFFSTAIGVKAARQTMHVSARDDSSSLLPISEEQCRVFPGTEEVSTTEVSITPLHEQISEQDITRPCLLKIDVQGYELAVLQGCELLLHCCDVIYCECSFLSLYEGQALADEVIHWLWQRGFVLQGVYNTSYDKSGKAVQADFLFKPKSD